MIASAGAAITAVVALVAALLVSGTGPVQAATEGMPVAPVEATPGKRAPAPVNGWSVNAENVGLAAFGLSCDTLPVYTGPARPAAGTRLKKVLITQPLDLSAGNIKVKKSCIRPTATGYHNDYLVTSTACADRCVAPALGGVVVKNSEISGAAMDASRISRSCGFLGIGTLKRNYIHSMGSGICFFETGLEYDAHAELNYVTGLRSHGDSHNEAATVRDFLPGVSPRKVTFLNNRLDCSSGNVTAGLFIQPTWSSIFNVNVVGNLIEGEGYNLYLDGAPHNGSATYGNMTATNNRFVSTGWGPSYVSTGEGWKVWEDNHVFSAEHPEAKGKAVRQ